MSHADNARPEVVPFVPAGITSLLDVGCSNGAFAATLRSVRPEVVVDGVEPDPVTAVEAKQHMRAVFEGFFPDDVPRTERYDCVAFLDSLEHMIDPWGALEAAKALLNPGGRVIASLPNVRHIHVLTTLVRHKDWPWEDENVFDRTHLRWFTRTSMIRLLEQTGYAVERIEPINAWPGLKVRLLAPLLGRDIAATQFAIVARPVAA